jgi:hypothetical protein
MECLPNRCIKCQTPIISGGRPLPEYNELVCDLENGSKMSVGICSACILEEKDLDEASGAIDRSMNFEGEKLPSKIKQIKTRKNYMDILFEVQRGVCLGCLKKLEKNWIVTNGVILHEQCNMPRPQHEYDDPRALGNVEVQEVRDAIKAHGPTREKNPTA